MSDDPTAPTAPATNDLDWPDCLNVRDLGGLPAGDDVRTRHGALIRSDSLHKLTADGMAAVARAGVGLIIDLRADAERGRSPNPYADQAHGPTPRYRSIPVTDPATGAPAGGQLPASLTDYYVELLDTAPDRFAEAVAAIADAPEGAVVVHCAAGQDRTGLVVGLTLAAIGVEPDRIAADYARTGQRLARLNAIYLAALTDPELRAVPEFFQHTPPATMLDTLGHLDEFYGGVTAYLEKGGLAGDRVTALATRLLERS